MTRAQSVVWCGGICLPGLLKVFMLAASANIIEAATCARSHVDYRQAREQHGEQPNAECDKVCMWLILARSPARRQRVAAVAEAGPDWA
jgi:hypothetical protein